MILVFILLIIVILIVLVILSIIFSSFHIKIKDLEISNMYLPHNSHKYKIELSLYLFNKIKWIWIKLDHLKLQRIIKKMRLEKLDFKKIEKDIDVEYLKQLKNIKPKISQLYLDLKIGTEDVILTSFLIFGISTLISLLLTCTAKKYIKDRYQYYVKPIYNRQNVYDIKLNSIIEIKMVHIINIIYIFVKKKKGDKNERTSNRRSYGYSYE